MNITLWIVQIVLALLCLGGGTFKIFKIDELQATVAAMRELPHGLWAFMGAIECLAGLAMILPGVLHVRPRFTPIAAAVLAAQSLLISGLYLAYGDFAPLPYSLAMALMAAFVAYGRFVLKPLSARS
jgi:DoxX-like protein